MEVWKDFFSKKEMAMTWDSAVKKAQDLMKLNQSKGWHNSKREKLWR